MSQLVIEGLKKRFGPVAALDGLSLEVKRAELLVILGPSGCGKTTLLRSIAGLERPDAGEIWLEGELVFSAARRIFLPPHRRRVGIVFQNYALWPHLNVFSNVAYPLRVKRFSKHEIRRRVGEMLKLVRLEGLERRYPHELSAGQQQRVALARALVMEPCLLLLDEPLSNLDAKLREELREELKRIQRKTGITTVHVTHDQGEAMALSDRIGVMDSGKLIQIGPPAEVYQKPHNEFVAKFVGASNLLFGDVKEQDGQRSLLLQGGLELPLSGEMKLPPGPALLLIRPEEITISRNGPGLGATVKSATYLGNALEYRLTIGGLELQVRTDPMQIFNVGERIFLQIRRATPIRARRPEQG